MPISPEIVEFMARRGDWLPGDSVIDIACGDGRDSALVAKMTPVRVTAMDIEPLSANADEFLFIQADVRNMPFENAQFDGLYCSYLYHLIEYKDKLIEECIRVTMTGRYIFFITTSEEAISRRFVNRYFPSLEKIDLYRYGTIAEMMARLEHAGLIDIGRAEFIRKTHHPRRDFLDVLRTRRWSSVEQLDEREYAEGTQAVSRDLPSLMASGVRWPEERTVVFGRRP